MKCPFCDSENTRVVDSRAYSEGYSIKRRRECNSCGKRFTTYEKVEETPFYVVKKDKSRERFDSEKLMRGLMRATVKRNISREELEVFLMDVEKTIHNSLKNEISTRELGELIMEKLKHFDEVAYVRFASVYMEFDDIKSFIEIVEDIKRK
ncbi:transcriptional regulator NrdR [uncultured Ilyobacter sp.]|uniref:transcriptional regulator NrdR n=1 Tax=uncultured Ilyobacter sp. TaxID=544433 RepID=UPI0029F51CC2|nr:transcriptional regulator NrdR [uncultured Ilyobacter sp.]